MLFRSFEYLMSRFSTPDEIFGPVSISRLKESDKYERAIDGYLPTADVVFLDEIWKAGPAIQNTLLTVINEKLFRNGDKELHLPLKLLVAASNELPAQGEGLEALWDRFLIRILCTCVKQEESFYKMLLDDSADHPETTACEWQISDREYAEWQAEIRRVTLPLDVLSCITAIRHGLTSVEMQDSDLRRNVYVSDRRWKNIVKLLKTSAFVHGRTEVSMTDLLPVYHCLWSEPDESVAIRDIVIRALFVSHTKQIAGIASSLKSDLKVSRVREALDKARLAGDRRDDDLLITEHFYYQVEKHGTGNTYIFIVDYKNLKEYSAKDAPTLGVMYADPINPKRTIIRAFAEAGIWGAIRHHGLVGSAVIERTGDAAGTMIALVSRARWKQPFLNGSSWPSFERVPSGAAHRTINKNAIPNDPEKPMVTSGVRIGTPAMTTRGFKEEEARLTANLIADVLDNPRDEANIAAVREKVNALTARFPVYR